MPSKRPTEIEPVPYLCPDIRDVAKIVRKYCPVGHPDRVAALRKLRFVQDGVEQLRFNASEYACQMDKSK